MESRVVLSCPSIAIQIRTHIFEMCETISSGYFPNSTILIQLFNILSGAHIDNEKLNVIPPNIEFLRQRVESYESDDPTSAFFSKLGGIPLLLQVLAFSMDHKEYDIEANCLAILMALTRTMNKDGNKVLIRGWGGLPLIVKGLYSPNETSQFWACAALRNIARSDNCKQKIGQLNAIHQLLTLMTSNNDYVKSSASSCLVNVSINKNNKCLIAHGIPLIVERLKSNDESLVHDSVWILSNLASIEDNRIKIVGYQGVELLLELLKSKNEQILERVASAIQNLACNDQVESMVVSNGGIELLIGLFEHKSQGTIHAACGALNNLTWKESHKDIFVKNGGIPIIVNLLNSEDKDTLIYATSILWNISYKNNLNICEIINHGALNRLVHLIKDSNDDLKNSSMGALQNMACEKNAKIQIVHSGAVDTLIQYLGCKSARFVKKAENILMNILNIKETAELLFNTHSIITLFLLLKEQPHNKNARGVLNKIRSHKLEIVVDDEHESVTGEGNFGDLVNNGLFSDVKIQVGDQYIHAHKAILFSRCEYWNKLYSCGMMESKEDIIQVPNQYSYQSYLELIRFIYSNSLCNISISNVVEILELADYYGVGALVRKCEVFLFKCATLETFCDLLAISKKFNANWLRTSLRKYALFKFDPHDLDLECIHML